MTALNTQVLERLLDEVAAAIPEGSTPNGRRGAEWAIWQMRAKVLAAGAVTAPRQSPLARRSDGWAAVLGARQVEPTRGTKKARVLGRLREAGGRWVNGEDLTAPDVGGAEGLRRCRELRLDDGWPVDRRRHPSGGRRFQYRLPLVSNP